MLIRFNVRNFLSFDENALGKSEEFSLIPGKVRNKTSRVYDDGNIKLLKFASIFGANNCGKSNLVKAISFMINTLSSGLNQDCEELFCKTDKSNIDKVSYFNIELTLNGKYYSYGFEVILSKRKITSEWLLEIGVDNKEKVIFTRDTEKGSYELGKVLIKSKVSNRINVYIDDIKNDSSVLFLNIINNHKDNLYKQDSSLSFIKDIYNYITQNIVLLDNEKSITEYSSITSLEKIEKLCSALHSFGTGLSSYKIEEVNIQTLLSLLPLESKNELQNILYEKFQNKKEEGLTLKILDELYFFENTGENKIKSYKVLFKKENSDYLFSLREESEGIRKFISMLDIILNKEERIYILDNIDKELHPCLTYKYIETFLQLAEKYNTQLIVTSHESRLLDLEILRRDEIWFINKNNEGNSNIYSLEDFNERYDKKIDKAYLEGRYDAVPLFTSIDL